MERLKPSEVDAKFRALRKGGTGRNRNIKIMELILWNLNERIKALEGAEWSDEEKEEPSELKTALDSLLGEKEKPDATNENEQMG